MPIKTSVISTILSLTLIAAPCPELAAQTTSHTVLDRLEADIGRAEDVSAIKRLQRTYGYYLDKNLWNDLADLFAEESSMELAQRGNHIQWQPVISVSDDGLSARIRSRMYQQMSRGERASMGAAIYENAVAKENGRWKFSRVHAFNTWGGGYADGWVGNASTYVPGPSADFPPDGPPTLEFQMFPNVYDIPYHYTD